MAAKASLCLAWSETPEVTFCCVVAHMYSLSVQGECDPDFGVMFVFDIQAKELIVGDHLCKLLYLPNFPMVYKCTCILYLFRVNVIQTLVGCLCSIFTPKS